MLTLAVALVASCNKADDYSMTQSEIDQAKYEAAFINHFGNPASNQDWGFGSTSSAPAFTRAAAQFGWEVSEGFDVEFDKQYYDDVLELLPEGVNAQGKLTNYEFLSNGPFQFCIIYSQTSANDKVGYYYYNPSTQTIADRTEVTFVEGIKDQAYFEYYSSNGWFINTTSGQQVFDWGVTKSHAKVFTVNVPAGYRVGFYVINGEYQMYSNQALNLKNEHYSAVVTKGSEAYLVGLEDWYNNYNSSDMDCNDIVMAINKTATNTPPSIIDIDDPDPDPDPDFTPVIRVMAEDLCASEGSDFDFNDVVFDVMWIDGGARIRVVAAGGTLPLKVGGEEVHGKFGVSTSTMVNTINGQKSAYPYVIFDISGSFNNDANNIPVQVYKNDEWQTLTAVKGKVASKIGVDPAVDWADEWQDIDEKWNGQFSEWVQGKRATFY